MEEVGKRFNYIVYFWFTDAREDSNEEGIVHNEVGVLKTAGNSVFDIHECRLTQEISCKKVAGMDFIIVKKPDKFCPCKILFVPDCNQESKPGWIAFRSGKR